MSISGLEGNMQAQPRVFAHDVVAITADANPIANTTTRGCCLYIGTGGNVTVTLESGNTVTFQNVPDGHFLPILVTHLTGGTASNILAIF